MTADFFYSDLDSDRDRRWIGYWAAAGEYDNVRFSDNEVLLSGTIRGRKSATNVEFADTGQELTSVALGGVLDMTEAITVSGEVSFSDAEGFYEQQFLRLQKKTADPVNFDLSDGAYGRFSFPTEGFSNAAELDLPIFFFQDFDSTSEDVSAKLDLDWEIDVEGLTTFEAGFRYQRLETDKGHLRLDIRRADFVSDATELESANLVEVFSNDDYLPNHFDGLPRSYVTFREDALEGGCQSLAAFYTPSEAERCELRLDGDVQLNQFDVDERFWDAYAKLNFEADGIVPIDGNFGVRVVNRDVTSTGNLKREETGTFEPNVFERTDTEWLPSAVVRMTVGEDLVLRLGAARTIAFPNTEDISNGLSLEEPPVGAGADEPGKGDGGAPDLDPFLATQLDTSLEWYFADESLVSAGLFHKDIDTISSRKPV